MGVIVERNKFRVRVSKDGVRHNVGLFDTKLKATRALNKFNRENRTDLIQEIYRGSNYIVGDISWSQLAKEKPTLIERLKNALNSKRTNTSSKK